MKKISGNVRNYPSNSKLPSSTVPGVNKTVEHLGRLLDEVGLIGIVLQLIIRLQVQDHIQSLPTHQQLLNQ
jgi:hypothetical protein